LNPLYKRGGAERRGVSPATRVSINTRSTCFSEARWKTARRGSIVGASPLAAMKAKIVLSMLALGAAGLMPAAFETVGVVVTVEPQIPARLRMEGLRDARV